MNTENARPMMCPSAQPEIEGSFAFGVIAGTRDNPRVHWIEQPVPVTPGLIALAQPVQPTQVLRFAAPCQQGACCHFDGKDCNLATRLVQLLPAVTETLPPCRIRPECRWFNQEGGAACRICPQVVTYCVDPSPEMNLAATPR